MCEYISLFTVFIKASICASHIKLKTQLISEYDYIQDTPIMFNVTVDNSAIIAPTLFKHSAITFVAIGAVLMLVGHHLQNECFYRRLVWVWDEDIREEMGEELTSSSRSCLCCLSSLSVMRYFNFMEWITLWKKRGWIIPNEHEVVRDHIQLVFVKWLRFYTIVSLIFKQILLLIMAFIVTFGKLNGPKGEIFDMLKLSNLPAVK